MFYPNRKAFLDMLAAFTGTPTNPLTRDHGYDVVVTGADGLPEIFTDDRDHPFAAGRPPKATNTPGVTSTGAGRYQVPVELWKQHQAELQLSSFRAVSQDLMVMNVLRSSEVGAIDLLDEGWLDLVIAAVAGMWPGLDAAGRRQELHDVYVQAGGEIK